MRDHIHAIDVSHDHEADGRPHHEVKPKPGDHPDRKWHPDHLRSGYHLTTWVIPTPDHPVIGHYSCIDGRTLEVRYLEVGPTNAPEFELEWSDGLKLTVLDHYVVEDYLEDAKRFTPPPVQLL